MPYMIQCGANLLSGLFPSSRLRGGAERPQYQLNLGPLHGRPSIYLSQAPLNIGDYLKEKRIIVKKLNS